MNDALKHGFRIALFEKGGCLMDTNKRIKEINDCFGWTIYKLSRESGIPTSTIFNMLRRGTSPSVSTLEKLCRAWCISLSQFFSDEAVSETEEAKQRQFWNKWCLLSQSQRMTINILVDQYLKEKKLDVIHNQHHS